MKKEVEGHVPAGERVVIVDDVITSGGSVMKAINAAAEVGANIVQVIGIVDREAGADEMFTQNGYDYKPIFSITDLMAKSDAIERAPISTG